MKVTISLGVCNVTEYFKKYLKGMRKDEPEIKGIFTTNLIRVCNRPPSYKSVQAVLDEKRGRI